MDATELNEWGALARIEPLGSERLEVLVAQLCALVFNAHRPKHAKPATASDYMPWTKDHDTDGGIAASAAAFHAIARKGKT
jgi:hypothetical protein